MPKIHLTQHAVERFVLRHRPDLTVNRALELLERGLNNVCRLREKTFRGQDQWQMTNPACVLVTKFTPSGTVCVTILPEPETRGIPEEELALMREYALKTPDWERLEKLHDVVDKAIETIEVTNVGTKQRAALIQRVADAEAKAAGIWQHIVQMYLSHSNSRKAAGMAHQLQSVKEDHRKAVQGLRLALRYMVQGGESSREEVLRAIAAVDPTYLTTAFITPELLSRTERKEEVLRVRSTSNSVSMDSDSHGHREGDS